MSDLSDLFAQLDFEDPDDVDDLTGLSMPDLAGLLDYYDHELKRLGELLAGPRGGTEEAREVHSKRGAVIVEMRKRGW